MAGYQYTIIIGNVGRVDDGALAYTQSGTARFRFSVFVTRKWTDRTTNEAREKTTIFNCTAWRQLAETCAQYVRTGMQIMVTGEVDASAYVGQDGEARASLDLTAQNVQFLGTRAASEREAQDADSDRMPF